jgi:hypothetical protein
LQLSPGKQGKRKVILLLGFSYCEIYKQNKILNSRVSRLKISRKIISFESPIRASKDSPTKMASPAASSALNYVVTAHPPTAITACATGNFLALNHSRFFFCI